MHANKQQMRDAFTAETRSEFPDANEEVITKIVEAKIGATIERNMKVAQIMQEERAKAEAKKNEELARINDEINKLAGECDTIVKKWEVKEAEYAAAKMSREAVWTEVIDARRRYDAFVSKVQELGGAEPNKEETLGSLATLVYDVPGTPAPETEVGSKKRAKVFSEEEESSLRKELDDALARVKELEEAKEDIINKANKLRNDCDVWVKKYKERAKAAEDRAKDAEDRAKDAEKQRAQPGGVRPQRAPTVNHEPRGKGKRGRPEAEGIEDVETLQAEVEKYKRLFEEEKKKLKEGSERWQKMLAAQRPRDQEDKDKDYEKKIAECAGLETKISDLEAEIEARDEEIESLKQGGAGGGGELQELNRKEIAMLKAEMNELRGKYMRHVKNLTFKCAVDRKAGPKGCGLASMVSQKGSVCYNSSCATYDEKKINAKNSELAFNWAKMLKEANKTDDELEIRSRR